MPIGKGILKLSLVVPVALYLATSEREKISFHQINKNTGNRIKYRKVDAETGDEVKSSDIIKGYQVGKDNISNSNQKNSKRLPSRVSAPLKSRSSCHARD